VKLTTYLHLVLRSKNAWNYTSTPPVRLHGVMLSYKKAQGQLYLFTYTSIPQYDFMAWHLVKHRGNFTFLFNWICHVVADGKTVGSDEQEVSWSESVICFKMLPQHFMKDRGSPQQVSVTKVNRQTEIRTRDYRNMKRKCEPQRNCVRSFRSCVG
jgi:hypothetical protein